METILITGANRGIGLALTKCFLTAGKRVIATCRNPDNAAELATLANTSQLEIALLDVTDEHSVTALVEMLGEQTIDVLVNNAGISPDQQSLMSMDYDAWRDSFEINTIAPFRLVVSLRPNLIKARSPRAITISSQMGALSRKSTGSYAYRSSKAAVNKVMQVLALELADDGIIACPVHPGWVQTDMGGPNADISVEESASGLFNLITTLTMEQSGRFWKWNGEEHSW